MWKRSRLLTLSSLELFMAFRAAESINIGGPSSNTSLMNSLACGQKITLLKSLWRFLFWMHSQHLRALPVDGSSSRSLQTLWRCHKSSSSPSCRWPFALCRSGLSRSENPLPVPDTEETSESELQQPRVSCKLFSSYLTSTALRTSLKTDLCFLLSFLARCLLQSVANAFSFSHNDSQSS